MTIRGWPVDDPTDPTSELEWRRLFRWLMESGVLAGEQDELEVVERIAGANMSVDVKAGTSFHVGHMLRSDAVTSVAIADNATGDDRIDLVVAGFDFTANTYTIYRKQGAAGGPVAPVPTEDITSLWEIALAEVLVEAGESTSIQTADITDVREIIDPFGGGGLFGPVVEHPAPGAAETIDLADGYVHDITFDDDTVITLDGWPAAGEYAEVLIFLREDGTDRTPVWPPEVAWDGGEPPLYAGANEVGSVALLRSVDSGVTVQGSTVWAEVAPPGSQVFSYTGAAQTFVVPDGYDEITVIVEGAEGGSTSNKTGGLGGRVTATIPVTPGETLQVNVGGQGANVVTGGATGGAGGWNGGGTGGNNNQGAPYSPGAGGGGGSDVRRAPNALADRLVIAGGGGGASGDGFQNGGAGGGAGSGTPSGGAGGNALSDPDGAAGTLGSGGAGGSPSYYGGGGGGGGYYGGGGGSAGGSGATVCGEGGSYGGVRGSTGGAGTQGSAGGGGGYAVPEATDVASVVGARAGNGQITIQWGL